jgi:hypothetical protein
MTRVGAITTLVGARELTRVGAIAAVVGARE